MAVTLFSIKTKAQNLISDTHKVFSFETILCFSLKVIFVDETSTKMSNLFTYLEKSKSNYRRLQNKKPLISN